MPLANGGSPPALDEPTTRRLFQNLDRVLQGVDVLRIVDGGRMSDGGLTHDFERLLESFRARGGKVEFEDAFARRSPPH